MTRIYNVVLRKHYTKDHAGTDVDSSIQESRTVAIVDGWAEDAIVKARELATAQPEGSQAVIDETNVVAVSLVNEAE